MSSAAFSTTIKAGGPSAAFTNEATTKVTANTVYQITDTAKRILDPSAALTVEVDADGAGGGAYATAAASSYTVDYLFGKVTFAADQGSSATVRISGSYLTPVDIAEANEFEITLTRSVQDASYFVSDGFKRKQPTLMDASGSVKTLTTMQVDHDAGGGTTKLSAALAAGTPLFLEIHPSATGDKFRAWVLLESTDESGSAEGLYSGTFTWQAAPVTGAGQTEAATFGFGT